MSAFDTAAPPPADGRRRSVRVTGPHPVAGTVTVPGDKSISHRALILAALADGTSRITGLSDGEDVRHTLGALRCLGAPVDVTPDGTVSVAGGALAESRQVIDVGNSGTGIRLLAGVAAAVAGLTVLQGDESIARRPMDRVAVPLRLMGARIDGREGGRFAPLVVRGGALRGIEYDSPVASAQVKSAILLAALSADGPTTVREPRPSRAHTEEMLAARGAAVHVDGTAVTVTPSRLAARDEAVPGDPSQAAFWLVAAAVLPGSDVTVPHIYLGPGRDGFLAVLHRMGADVTVERSAGGGAAVRVRHAALHATDIEPDELPGLIDELPILAVAAALAEGTTTVRGAEELRHKETDRIATIAAMQRAFGVAVEEYPDGFAVTGRDRLAAATVDSRGDHRIAMAGAIAALAAQGTTVIEGFDAVATSYPAFLDDLRLVAGDVATF